MAYHLNYLTLDEAKRLIKGDENVVGMRQVDQELVAVDEWGYVVYQCDIIIDKNGEHVVQDWRTE